MEDLNGHSCFNFTTTTKSEKHEGKSVAWSMKISALIFKNQVLILMGST